jgi:hypothetical protein
MPPSRIGGGARGGRGANNWRRAEGTRLRRGPRDLEALLAHLGNGLVEPVAGARRVLGARGPRGVVVAAARARADEGEALRQRAAPARRRRAADALQEEDPLVGEPEMLGERRAIRLVLAAELFERAPEIVPRAPRLCGARLRGEVLKTVANAPRAQEGGGEDAERGRERPLRVHVLEVPPEPLLRANLFQNDLLPRNAERVGAQQKIGARVATRRRAIGVRSLYDAQRRGGRRPGLLGLDLVASSRAHERQSVRGGGLAQYPMRVCFL